MTENQILELVANKVNRPASFTNGCLFVECNEGEARTVFHTLSKQFGLGKVYINGPIQGEYAYDIV